MLAFVDFVPRQVRAPRLSFSLSDMQGQCETFEAALQAANPWLRRANARVVNVETVVLPNLWAPGEQGSTDPVIATAEHASFHQFIRVWYHAE
ncbi:MAG: hypothetical protein ACK47B_15565 [Armatimonadota bacterium]